MNIRDLFKKVISNKRLLLIIIAGIVVGVVLFYSTSNIQKTLFKKKAAAKKPGEMISYEEEALPVKVYKMRRMDFKDTLPVMGNIKGFKEFDLKFQVAGILESFNFEEGERIQEGDIIASLVQKDALLKLKYGELELTKNKKLFEIGAIAPPKLEQTKLEYESAKSELDKTNIYAVSDAFLGSRTIDPGAYITPNDKVGTFVSIDKVYADFSVIEKDVPKVVLGQKVEVFVDTYPNKSFTGTVDRIAAIIEGRSRTQNVKAEIDNKDRLLKPGMFTRGLIATYEKKEALVVPTSSLKKKEADYFVYVVHKESPKDEAPALKKDKEKKGIFDFLKRKKKEAAKSPEKKETKLERGSIEVRKIKLGYMTQDFVEIEEGLKEDELIAVEVHEELKDKAKVEISEVQEGLF